MADGVMDAAAAARAEDTQRPAEQRNQALKDRQMGKIAAALDYMDADLGDQVFCVGVNLCLADIAVGSALGYLDFRFPDLNWRAQHDNLKRLYEKLDARPSFISTRHIAA